MKHVLEEKVKLFERQVLELRNDQRARDEADAEIIGKIKDLFIYFKTALASFVATPYDLPHRLDLRSLLA